MKKNSEASWCTASCTHLPLQDVCILKDVLKTAVARLNLNGVVIADDR